VSSLVLGLNVCCPLRPSLALVTHALNRAMASAFRRAETSGSVHYSATSVGASTALAQLLPALDDEVDLSGVTGEQRQLFRALPGHDIERLHG